MALISQSGLVTEKLLKGCHLEPKLIRAIPQLQFHCLGPLHCILPYFFLFSFLTFSSFAVFDISESALAGEWPLPSRVQSKRGSHLFPGAGWY